MKKTAAVLLCTLLIACLLPASAQENETLSSGDFQYSLAEDDTAVITKHVPTQIVIPETLDGRPVTAIAKWALTWNDTAESILLPESLRGIGEFSLYSNNALKSILIPAGVTSVGYAALYSCPSLSEILVSPDNPVYDSADGVLFDREKKMLHTYPAGRPGARYEVPPGTLLILDYAFSKCPLQEIVLPDSVTELGFMSFSESLNLAAVEIPKSVTVIGGNTFKGCTGLTSLTLPRYLTELGTDAFAGCPALTLQVYEGSYAHQYAVENNIPFTLLQE